VWHRGARCHDGEDGDHAGSVPVVMEIVPERWRWRSTAQKEERLYHVTLFLHVMLILFMHLILLRTAVAL